MLDWSTAVLTILLCPIGAFAVQTFIGRRLPRGGDWVSIIAILVSWGVSIQIFIHVLQTYDPKFKETLSWAWINLPGFTLNFGILIDNVTALMLVVVTTVSALVHIYSVGYMKGDARYFRFFAYLSLFSFSMLGLVLVDNLFGLYIFWELVGLSSYLLISFWFEKPSAAAAGKKAFIVTRIGDIGLFIGILIIFVETGLFNYEAIFKYVAAGSFTSEVFWVLPLNHSRLGALYGCGGKIGTISPSRLAAGCHGRPNPYFCPDSRSHHGGRWNLPCNTTVRLFYARCPTLHCIHRLFYGYLCSNHGAHSNDIKKVLAYSTISQLGYMMMGLGVGAYTAGFFHLVTHGAFKACLFLCAGSVIHAVHTQDMRQMGGLRKKMPITFWTMLIATLALSGVPFFSGFVSKDMILAGTLDFATKHPLHSLIPLFGFVAAGLTAFYMFRLIFMTFFGVPNDTQKYNAAHESGFSITLPLIILSTLSFAIFFTGSLTGAGELHLFGDASQWFTHLIQKPILGAYKYTVNIAPLEPLGSHGHSASHTLALILSVAMAAGGILLAYLMYIKKTLSAEHLANTFKGVYRTLVNLYWIDELYEWAIIRNQVRLNNVLARFDNEFIDRILVDGWSPITKKTSTISGDFDNQVIDEKLVDGSAKVIGRAGAEVRKIQTGQIQQYLMIGLGAIIVGLVLYFIFD